MTMGLFFPIDTPPSFPSRLHHRRRFFCSRSPRQMPESFPHEVSREACPSPADLFCSFHSSSRWLGFSHAFTENQQAWMASRLPCPFLPSCLPPTFQEQAGRGSRQMPFHLQPKGIGCNVWIFAPNTRDAATTMHETWDGCHWDLYAAFSPPPSRHCHTIAAIDDAARAARVLPQKRCWFEWYDWSVTEDAAAAAVFADGFTPYATRSRHADTALPSLRRQPRCRCCLRHLHKQRCHVERCCARLLAAPEVSCAASCCLLLPAMSASQPLSSSSRRRPRPRACAPAPRLRLFDLLMIYFRHYLFYSSTTRPPLLLRHYLLLLIRATPPAPPLMSAMPAPAPPAPRCHAH